MLEFPYELRDFYLLLDGLHSPSCQLSNLIYDSENGHHVKVLVLGTQWHQVEMDLERPFFGRNIYRMS